MKIRLSILLLGLFLLSCKKDRVCECTTTWTFQYSNGSGFDTRIFPSDSKGFKKGLTKKQAINACKHQRATVQTSFEDLITDHGNEPLKPGEKVLTECDLH